MMASSFAVFTTEIEFDYNTIAGRIRELAFLNPEVFFVVFVRIMLHFLNDAVK